jgi:hypothetical protein
MITRVVVRVVAAAVTVVEGVASQPWLVDR